MEQSTIIAVLLIVLVAWLILRGFRSTKGLTDYSSEQFGERMKEKSGTVLIDVREVSEFRGGRLPGAMNIPLSQLPQRTAEIARDREVLLYCRSGMRSKRAAAFLRSQGFEKIGHLRGGIMAWQGEISK